MVQTVNRKKKKVYIVEEAKKQPKSFGNVFVKSLSELSGKILKKKEEKKSEKKDEYSEEDETTARIAFIDSKSLPVNFGFLNVQERMKLSLRKRKNFESMSNSKIHPSWESRLVNRFDNMKICSNRKFRKWANYNHIRFDKKTKMPTKERHMDLAGIEKPKVQEESSINTL